VDQALPTVARRFTRDRLVRSVRRLVAEGLAEPGLLARAVYRQPQRRPALDAVVRYLRNHRRESGEPGIAAASYRPPTLAQVARHLKEDARLSPPGGGTWVPSSVKALIDQAVWLSGPVSSSGRPSRRRGRSCRSPKRAAAMERLRARLASDASG
jgi:hypothetical protein